MGIIKEFHNTDISRLLLDKIRETAGKINRPLNIMEVCGGHTFAILKFGIDKLLPENVNLISGPGCPVCVTSQSFIDEAIAYSSLDKVMIATFGDIVRVPGSYSSLDREKARGAEIKICYSPDEALQVAEKHSEKEVLFLGIGFETTAPLTASLILEGRERGIRNFSVLSAHKTMPEALMALLKSDKVKVDGLICPGHVATITGLSIFQPIPEKLKIPAVVCGFEQNDILQCLFMLLRQIENQKPALENQYSRAVKTSGNLKAQQFMSEVFVPVNALWRGIGEIPNSGLDISPPYDLYNVRKKIKVELPEPQIVKGCICGEIMQGLRKPSDCALFGNRCTPDTPQGACMVSSEGSCAAYYRYRE